MLCGAVLLLSSLIQVFSRYILGGAVSGTEEISRYMMITGVYLSLPILTWRNEQLAVDAIHHFLPRRFVDSYLKRFLLIVDFLFLALLACLAAQLTLQVYSSGQASVTLNIPLAIPMSTVAVGAVLGSAMGVGRFVRTFLPDDSRDVASFETFKEPDK